MSMYTAGIRRLHIDDDAIAIGRNGTTDISTSTTDLVTRIDSTGMKTYYNSQNYTFVSSSGMSVFAGNYQRASIGSTIVLAVDTTAATTDSVVITGGGVKIYDTSTDFIHMSADGLKVYDGDVANPNAVFGDTTYVGLQASEHVKITSGKLEIKNGSRTFASASAGGLYTSGSIHASQGVIGGWTIVSGSIESNTSDFRGVKIKAGKGIDGYSTTAHNKSTDQGKFNFGIAPAPGGEPGCFLAGTLIQMLNGIKRIEDVIVGDVVKSFDLKTNSIKDSKVLWLSVHDDFDYMIINGIIKVTSNHPFYSDGNWIEAGDLSVGDKILHIDGLEHTIKTIELSNELTTVYNFEVEGYHNYFAEGYLVHNAEKDAGDAFTP